MDVSHYKVRTGAYLHQVLYINLVFVSVYLTSNFARFIVYLTIWKRSSLCSSLGATGACLAISILLYTSTLFCADLLFFTEAWLTCWVLLYGITCLNQAEALSTPTLRVHHTVLNVAVKQSLIVVQHYFVIHKVHELVSSQIVQLKIEVIRM